MSAAGLFGEVLAHVLGQPLAAGAYVLEENPLQTGRGLFRYGKRRENGLYAFIEFQSLYNEQNDLAHFRILLVRNDQPAAHQPTPYYEAYDLAYVIYHEFGAQRVLGEDSHWWRYKTAADLAPQLLEGGRLLFAYGVPWLEDSY